MNSNWKRDAATIAGGLAVGIIGSRLLAPVFATASGSVRARMGRDPFERLIDDHRYILSVLEEMENTPADSTVLRAKQFLMLKRTLAKHALAEEDVVYPLLHEDLHAEDESNHLYREHADMKVHLFELERLLKNGEDWSARSRQLRNLIQDHARQEEEVEFPRLREALNEKRTRKLSRQIHREEALIL
jgi:hemerythrin superfamily protein